MPEVNADLRAEYAIIQGQYEAFDARALTIKSWSVPLLAGGVGLGLEKSSIGIELATVLAAVCLWTLEAIWKNFQYCYIARIQLLEHHFKTQHAGEQIAPFQIFSAWGDEWRRWFGHRVALQQRLTSPFVYLPYLPIVIAAMLSILWIAVSPDEEGRPSAGAITRPALEAL